MTILVAAGDRLEVRLVGPKPARIVFLHEGLGCVTLWRDFPDRVSERTGLGALVYSRRGYGASDAVTLPRPVGFMHDEADRVLPALLEVAGVENPILVGHSDGASIALIYAAHAPSSVRGVVAIAPHVFVERVTVESIARLEEAYRTTDLPTRLRRRHGANAEGAFWGWTRVWLDPAFRAWNIEEELGKITAPILVVQGENDEYGTLAHVHAIERRATSAVTTRTLARCGHSPHRDQPEATLDAIATFIERTRAPVK
jgi:pimeloyl-ACP methyl ester carboxylesterase